MSRREQAPGQGGQNVENMDEYEREKIATTLKSVEHLAVVIRGFLEQLDECDRRGILLDRKARFGNIRRPGGLAEPDGPILELTRMFEAAKRQADLALPRGPEKM